MIFNAEMVRAILSGQKTQTRRIMKNQPAGDYPDFPVMVRNIESGFQWHGKHGESSVFPCPLGTVGDRIWVRETWQGPLVDFERSDDLLRNPEKYEKPENCVYAADGVPAPEFYDADDNLRCCWRPSIHMPRWASRILLEITNVRVERLNDISEGDAIAEGIERYNDDGIVYYGPYGKGDCRPERAFSDLWKSIYGDESWEKNPWVWCISFKRVQEQSND
ncbi:morphogenetic protein [Obesumbacterium proteus]|nr:morphogenetic protein [Obesumbacterium proteus]MCE9886217.1 morphogenetic protein [Obesumbacterium proteus]MCE9914889.1 morphogenetic protein [Obesumbacterium proteus]MCE9931614.1 morphogenetic protein [Obesumbacterium proteus]MCG2876061.1 morphogenetic protein [Obesumbacterium proteus]